MQWKIAINCNWLQWQLIFNLPCLLHEQAEFQDDETHFKECWVLIEANGQQRRTASKLSIERLQVTTLNIQSGVVLQKLIWCKVLCIWIECFDAQQIFFCVYNSLWAARYTVRQGRLKINCHCNQLQLIAIFHSSGLAGKRRGCFQYELIITEMVDWGTMYSLGYLYPVDGYQPKLLRVLRHRQ